MNTDSERGEGSGLVIDDNPFAEEFELLSPTVEEVVSAVQIAIEAPTCERAWNDAVDYFTHMGSKPRCCRANPRCGEYCNFVCKLYTYFRLFGEGDHKHYLYELLMPLVRIFKWRKEECEVFEDEIANLGIYPSLAAAD